MPVIWFQPHIVMLDSKLGQFAAHDDDGEGAFQSVLFRSDLDLDCGLSKVQHEFSISVGKCRAKHHT